MAAITDPVAVSFCNAKVRPVADAFAKLEALCVDLNNSWTALGGTTLIPNTSDIVVDGASVNGTTSAGGDGRPVITGAMVSNIVNRVAAYRSFMERNTLDGTGTANNAVLGTVLQVAVNTKP